MKVYLSREELQRKVDRLQLELVLLEEKIGAIYDKPNLVIANGGYKLFDELSALTAKVESLEELLASDKNSVTFALERFGGGDNEIAGNMTGAEGVANWDNAAEKVKAEFGKLYKESSEELMTIKATDGREYVILKNFAELRLQTLNYKMLIMLDNKVLASFNFAEIEKFKITMNRWMDAIRRGDTKFRFDV